MEIWKDIIGYEGLYQVSKKGIVKRVPRFRNANDGKNIYLKEKEISSLKLNRGYVRVQLFKDGHQKSVYLHRIIACSFIDNPHNKPCINHKDGNPSNNNIENLEWCTYSENAIHARKVLGKVILKKGKDCKQSKAVYLISIKNGEILGKFGSIKEANRVTGVHRITIYNCLVGKKDNHKDTTWSFDQSEPIEHKDCNTN